MKMLSLNAIIRGGSMAELIDNANAVAARFFGDTPYTLEIGDWDMAAAEYDEADGSVSNFQFSMVARPVRQ